MELFFIDQPRDLGLMKFQIQICVLPKQGKCRADAGHILHTGFHMIEGSKENHTAPIERRCARTVHVSLATLVVGIG